MSVDASGNYAVFGNLGAGSVTIFRINGSNCFFSSIAVCSLPSRASSLPLGVTASQFQRIVPTDNQSDDQFGWAVDIDLPFVVPSSRELPPPM